MKKAIVLIAALALAFTLLVGLPGIPAMRGGEVAQEIAGDASAVKTGLSISASAAGSGDNAAEYELILTAVTVDDGGVIASCAIDGVSTAVHFNENGVITTDLNAEIPSKNELGADYGMVAYGGAKYEWNQQAAALADYAVGKTVEQLRSGAVDARGYAADVDLASSATIRLDGLVNGIEAAVRNASHLGAQQGDVLKLSSIQSIADSKNAGEDADGVARLDSDVAALTMRGDVITSCVIDSLQADVRFDSDGELEGDVSAPLPSKNQLGANYGMKAYGGARYEWNEQAANFSAYVTGKTGAQVAGIAVDEGGKARDADLVSRVTIAIGGFQELVGKAVA
ncbi:MAG: hypothetical protein IJ466_10300 [Clostridia bacterium]|nr:hypothetical protein [Clostridia bacterium]